MSRAKFLIKKMGGKIYDIFSETITIDPDTGADNVKYSKTDSVLAYIQPTGSGGSVKGIVLQDNRSGDSKISDFFMYHEKILKEHDRVFYGKYWYEIRASEPWESSFMKFNKSYLVKVDGQK